MHEKDAVGIVTLNLTCMTTNHHYYITMAYTGVYEEMFDANI